MDLRAKIGYKLKRLRLEADISQEKLAEYLGVHIPVSYTHLRARDTERSRMPSSA